MQILVDKSYLHGSTKNEISQLCYEHDVIVPQVLFYELLTTTPDSRKKCVSKLPEEYGAYDMIPGVGEYLSLEAGRQEAATPVVAHKMPNEPRINPLWANDDFHVSADQEIARSEWIRVTREGVKLFHDIAKRVPQWFPILSSVSDDIERKDACNKIKIEACKEPQNVRDFYEGLEIKGYPPASIISPSWIVFQHTKMNLLYSIDHFARHGFSISKEPPKRVEQEVHDLEYVIFGALCGALASDDLGMQMNFRLACPEGHLLSHSRESGTL